MFDSAIISVVDDDELILVSLKSLLRSCGYTVKTYNSALAFLRSDDPQNSDFLVSDIQMPGMCGVELYEALAARNIHIPTLFITGKPGLPPQFSVKVRKPEGYFSKPFDTQALLTCIERALQRRR
ncbi:MULTISPECIES: response regulator [unclassified Pseudomonas]|uniref:response regulator transcription factor n=1 Tax=unclassified Pseudomonas TaxID=196821 RepID=UPI00164586FE|nr:MULTISPECIES: response regulator [unclassified Pseudomonas]MBC3209454.1 response regulator [Pseudomonas sp. SWRI111]MBC3269039.1 response regulator [Pseudomonas sp. SWRI81]MBC3776555.1 response regulator [Pseudomonas sp. SWRI99]